MRVSGACTQIKTSCARVVEKSNGPDTVAVIVAGGIGERFGYPGGKQFINLCGLPLMSWSILAFDHAPSIAHVVIACSPEKADAVRESVLSGLKLHKPITFAASGKTRQASVYSALKATPRGFDLVAVHDAVRPLIEVETIERVISRVRSDAALAGAICATRAVDTLKRVEGSTIVSTPERSFLWAAQTPQVFRKSILVEAHERALQERIAATDDSSLVEHLGGVVEVVESSNDNIKVTYPSDLTICEALLGKHLMDGADSCIPFDGEEA